MSQDRRPRPPKYKINDIVHILSPITSLGTTTEDTSTSSEQAASSKTPNASRYEYRSKWTHEQDINGRIIIPPPPMTTTISSSTTYRIIAIKKSRKEPNQHEYKLVPMEEIVITAPESQLVTAPFRPGDIVTRVQIPAQSRENQTYTIDTTNSRIKPWTISTTTTTPTTPTSKGTKINAKYPKTQIYYKIETITITIAPNPLRSRTQVYGAIPGQPIKDDGEYELLENPFSGRDTDTDTQNDRKATTNNNDTKTQTTSLGTEESEDRVSFVLGVVDMFGNQMDIDAGDVIKVDDGEEWKFGELDCFVGV